MPIIIFTAHGETISPDATLTAASCLLAIRKVDAIMACLPLELRLPRPDICCGDDNESRRTAELIGSCLCKEFSLHEGLADVPGRHDTRGFAAELLARQSPCVIVSHSATIDMLIADIAAFVGEEIALPEALGNDGVIAIDARCRPLRMIFRKATSFVSENAAARRFKA